MIMILLPAYNEELSLPKLLPKIQEAMTARGQDYRIAVCDDGSSDRTGELLRQYAETLPLDIVAHRINRGLGESSRDLFEHAVSVCADDDVIVRLDCDDTHDPNFIPALTAKIAQGYDVAIASRFQPGGGQVGVARNRAFLSRCANLFMKCFFPIPGVWEYSCGFRAYRAGLVKRAIAVYGNDFIQLKGLGFTCTLEKLVKLHLLKARFGEVPFVLRYDQKESESKMVSSVTTLGYLVLAILYHWPWGGWRVCYRSASSPA